jgi:hypothetical protein
MMNRAWPFLAPFVVAGALVASDASSAEEKIALGEVSVPETNAPPGVDPATLRSAAEGELRSIDPAKLHNKKRVVVSVSVAETRDRPAVAVSVNAMLRDGKSGTMLAIIEGRARAEGGASPELRKAVLRAAVKSAVSQIPAALSP